MLRTGLRRVTLCLLCLGSLREGSNAKGNKPPSELGFWENLKRLNRALFLTKSQDPQVLLLSQAPALQCCPRGLRIQRLDFVTICKRFLFKEGGVKTDGRKGLAKDLEPSRCSHGTCHSGPCGKQSCFYVTAEGPVPVSTTSTPGNDRPLSCASYMTDVHTQPWVTEPMGVWPPGILYSALAQHKS